MRYNNLHDLINYSSSTKRYFLSLPTEIQTALNAHNHYIHTAEDLRYRVGVIENYRHHCKLSDGKKQ